VWTQEFVARHLALFIALHFKREQERTNAPTRSSRNKRQKGSKTMNDLKRAFKKLLGSYTDAKVLYDNEKMAASVEQICDLSQFTFSHRSLITYRIFVNFGK